MGSHIKASKSPIVDISLNFVDKMTPVRNFERAFSKGHAQVFSGKIFDTKPQHSCHKGFDISSLIKEEDA